MSNPSESKPAETPSSTPAETPAAPAPSAPSAPAAAEAPSTASIPTQPAPPVAASAPVPQAAPPAQVMVTEPPVRGSRLTPVLAVLTVLLLFGGGVLTVMYFDLKKKSDATIATQKAEIESLTKDLRLKSDSLDKATSDLSTANSDAAAAKEKATKYENCVKAAHDLVEAATKGQDALNQASVTMFLVCGQVTVTT